ncbi:MAG TPA: polysaccharide deacetylase family protein [Negativicutes bacterium]|jgi:peptidoglycan/xylan/chitin deacetylase (PgdA/CDA1 family)
MNKKMLLSLCLLLPLVFITACTPYRKPENTPPQTEPTPVVDTSEFNRGHNIPGKLYWAGSVKDKKVALTFDDGPENHWTPQILEVLQKKKVKATFFVIGKQVQSYPEVLRQIYDQGHVIGNHTLNHADLTKMSAPEVEKELEDCAAIIQGIIGKSPRLVRPPFGFHNTTVDDTVYSKNQIIVLWSIDTEDWQGLDAKTIKDSVLPKMKNGYIILQHSGVNPHLQGSLEALPAIIDGLRSQGFEFVTIPELLRTEPYQ